LVANEGSSGSGKRVTRNAEEIQAAMMPWILYVLLSDMPHKLSHLVVELSVVVVPGLCEDDRKLVQLLPKLMLCSKDIAESKLKPPELDQLLKIAGEKAAAATEVTKAATKASSRL
jgi:hypothetical protein